MPVCPNKTYIFIIMDPIRHIYEDMMFMMKHALDEHHILNDYLYYHVAQQKGLLKNDEETQLIFMGTKYLFPNIVIPKGSILTDFDHEHWMLERWNMDLLEGNKVMTFSKILNDKLRAMSPQTPFSIFKFGYAFDLDYGYSYDQDYDYDICFLGTIYERRRAILDRFSSKYRCFFHNHIEEDKGSKTRVVGTVLRGHERADIYKKSKIILSIAFNEEYLACSNASRIFPAVCTGGFVIAERCLDEDQNTQLDQICVNVPLDELYKQVEDYIADDTKREQLRYQHYRRLKTMTTDIPC